MAQVLLVGFAGGLGTIARYLVGLWAVKTLGTSFPYGTLIVNVLGCFFMSLVVHLALATSLVSPALRLTLATGFLGGFTTYSSFNFETMSLLREPTWLTALANLGITLVGCFLAGLLGLMLAKRIAMLA